MAETTPTTFPIICPVTRWHYKRRAFMIAMLFGFGLWFYIDGRWTWPAENEKAAKYEWFQNDVVGGYDHAKREGSLEQWIADKRAQGYPLKANGEPEKWVSYAARQGWPEKPKKRTEKELAGQFHYAYAMFVGAAAVAILTFLGRRKKLIGYEDHLISPEGVKMSYADAFKIDKRPWDIKGLAYVYHRPNGSAGTGNGSKITLDDLKYDGTARVLDSLMKVFRGELIEKKPDQDPATSDNSNPEREA